MLSLRVHRFSAFNLGRTCFRSLQRAVFTMGVSGNDIEEAERRAKEAEETIEVLKVQLQFLQKVAGMTKTMGLREQLSITVNTGDSRFWSIIRSVC